MKRLILLFIVVVLLGSCGQSDEKKAKFLIKEYLKENLHDLGSYESVSFGNLDTQYMFHREDIGYKEAVLKLERGMISGSQFRDIRDSIKNNIENNPVGLVMRHKYRAKNGFGAKSLYSKVFSFDMNLKHINSVDDTLD